MSALAAITTRRSVYLRVLLTVLLTLAVALGSAALLHTPAEAQSVPTGDPPWAWGYNGYGQLGDGTNTNRSTPMQVSGLTGVVALTGGGNHSLAVAHSEIPPTCYALTLSHTGSGSDPVASPANSTGCPSGQYVAVETIGLTASPASGWQVASWSGTGNDASTATTNSATMPAGAHTVSVAYSEIPLGLPGLVATGFSAAESGRGGKTLLVTWTVRNQGSGDASSAWLDYVYLSADGTLNRLPPPAVSARAEQLDRAFLGRASSPAMAG